MPSERFPPRVATRYTTVAITLHWLIAVLMFLEVGLGLRMGQAHGLARFAVFQLHKSIGITILLLAAIRLLWRFYRTPPPITAKPWEKALALVAGHDPAIPGIGRFRLQGLAERRQESSMTIHLKRAAAEIRAIVIAG